jgi:cell division septum initiation protein DivIVA
MSELSERRALLSPHEIRNARIRQIGIRRGYDKFDVDTLLWRIAAEIAAREGVITDLATRLERAEREVYARKHGYLPDAGPRNLDDLLIEERVNAQRYADEMIASAQYSAAQLVQHGRNQAASIIHQAHEVAEQAARDYRARAGHTYSADREELARLATLAAWAMRQFAGLRKQVDATDDAAQAELATIFDRLQPILGAADANGKVPSHLHQGPEMSGKEIGER